MSKDNRPKPRLPRGFTDRDASDLAATDNMLRAIRETYELYGFEALETPFVEYTDALGKFLPDLDRPNEGVFSFQDDDEQWLSLRYDLTAPLARFVAENFDALPKPYRSYRAGWVFRNEKPGPGRFRQFMQFDADTVGSSSVAADAEMCMLAADTLERLGVKRGDYVIKVNNRKVLDGVMEAIGLGGEDKAGQRLTVLRAIDKLDRLGLEGVRQLLGPGRRDESGDYTKGAELPAESINEIVDFLRKASLAVERMRAAQASGDAFREIADTDIWIEREGEASFYRDIAYEGMAELEHIRQLVRSAGYDMDRIIIDPSVVRGLEYYTGPVYEAELTFEVQTEQGQPVRFGSVGGGGRYDGLVGRFRNEPVPATGFSIGVSRLLAALQAVKSPVVSGRQQLPLVVVTAMDPDHIAHYQHLTAMLRSVRDENDKPVLRAEMYLGKGRFGAQMKYADRRGAAVAIIQGSDERANGKVQVKDLIEGMERGINEAASDKSNAEYKAARLAQSLVPESEMVAEVRRVLARHSS